MGFLINPYRFVVFTWDTVWGFLTDKTIEDCTTYANTTEGDSKYPTTDTTHYRLNPTTDVIDTNFATVGHHTLYRDLTGAAISDTAWVLQFKVVVASITSPSAGLSHSIYYGMSSLTSTPAVAKDFLGVAFYNQGTGPTKEIYAVGRDGVILGIANDATSQVFTHAFQVETIYIRLRRLSATSFKVEIYSDSAYTTSIESKTITIPSTIQGLRYFFCGVYDNANVTGYTINIDDIQIRDGQTTP